MTDKQSTVVVSRELLERVASGMWYADSRRKLTDELDALLAATPDQSEQALDMVEPVAEVWADEHGVRAMLLEAGHKLTPGTKLYRHAQPPAKPRITMADTMRAYQSAARSSHLVGTSNWCAHLAEQLNSPQD